ncbi:S49 family peptidase [Azotobacter beijerinckii]|nr:S49 family peptidase [Azotobacter beijerinckii]
MLPESLDALLAIADRQGNPEALEARLGRPLDNTRAVTLRDGVAVIPITGPIMRYANLFTRISGATSTQELATDLRTALDDPKVKAIVLNIDSPGGEATGINELADMVYAARSRKPIKAYVGGTGASAAYWIASAAGEVVVDDTALLGSIGVVLEVAVRQAEAGQKRYTLVSSNAPNKRPDVETERGRAEIAKTIDALADVFTAKVARNLGVKPEKVAAMGDHGGVRVGAAAVEAGLAHRTGSLEALIAELSGRSGTWVGIAPTVVRTTAEFRAAIAAGVDPRTIQIGNLNAIRAQAAAAAILAERERAKRIRAMAVRGLEDTATAAIASGISAEAAALSLLKAAKERGIKIGV